MSDPDNHVAHAAGHHAAERAAEETVYRYEGAGIAEREGHVPVWLWGVVLVLLIWGVYYLVAYWNAPIGTP